jgi:hypothetical protein
MNDLPSGWDKLRLGDIAIRTSNVDPSRCPEELFELYSVPSFSIGEPDRLRGKEIKSSKQAVEPDDILLCKIVPHINRVWTVAAKSNQRQIASSEWIVYRTHHSDPHYLRYCLSEACFRERFMSTVAGVGGSLMRARPSEVAKIDIPLAPLPEQRRIVTKINSLSAKSIRARDHLEHIPRLVEKYKQAILAAAFQGQLTREWRFANLVETDAHSFMKERTRAADELRKSAGRARDEKTAQLVPDSDLGAELARADEEQRLPPSWCWTSIGVVFGVYVGATPSRSHPEFWGGPISWVSSGEVAFCRIDRTNETITILA